ncbi:DUF1616 domain-containing protein [Natrialbaceae archaeon A-gly3]
MSLREATTTRLESLFRYPGDLAVTSVVALLAYYLVTTLEPGGELRILAALPLVLFLPGYALVSVLFPTRGRVIATGEGTRRGVDVAERLGLALAVSIALVPIVVIALSLSVGVTPETTAGAFAGLAVALAQLGVVRRLRIPHTDRFSLSSVRLFDRTGETGALATASTLVLVVAIVVAGTAFAFAFVSPGAAGGFTQLGLYTEEDGELVAGGFPSAVEPGESIPVVVDVENQEGEDRTYTAVVQQQLLEDEEVVERTTLEAFTLEVEDGESVATEREITPTVEAEDVRVVVLLYEDDVPAEPARDTADEDTFFWVDSVEDAEEDDGNETDNGGDIGLEDAGDNADGEDDADVEDEDGIVDDGLEAAEDGIDAIQDGIDAVSDLFGDD